MTGGKLTRRYLAHFGAILMNLGIVGMAYTLFALFSGIFMVFYMLFLVMITIVTLGLCFLTEEGRAMWDSIDTMGENLGAIYNSLIYVIPIVIVLLTTSLVFLLMDKNWSKSKPRIIVNIVILSIMALFAIVFIINFASGNK